MASPMSPPGPLPSSPSRAGSRAAAFAALLLAGPAALGADGRPFVPVEVIDIPEAMGVPDGPSCDEVLAEAARHVAARGPLAEVSEPSARAPATKPPAPPEPETSTTPEPPGGAVEIGQVPNPVVTRSDLRAGRVPGADLDALPLQPLEADAAVTRAIGDVMRLASAGQPVRVTFYGASHVGGDFFTGHLRRLLQARHGDAGHGFVFPAALYRYHRASDVNLCRTPGWRPDWVGREGGNDVYGFAGASLSSRDPTDLAWMETTRTNPQGRAFSQVDLFVQAHPGGGGLVVTADDAAPRVISTYAAQPALRHVRVKLSDGPHRVRLQPMGDGEVRVLGASLTRDTPGVVVDSIGIRGRTAKTWLAWDPDVLTQGIRALAPDLLVLAYGTNEAADTDYTMGQYADDLRAVLARARAAAPGVACLLVGPSDRGVVRQAGQRWAVWGRTRPVAQVQRDVAREAGCAFWDWQAATGGPGSMVAWREHDPPLAGHDLIHFSQAGYERSAERLLDALDDAAIRSGGARF